MNVQQFVCLKHQDMINRCQKKCKSSCVTPWNVCRYLRLCGVSLGSQNDIICKEFVILGSPLGDRKSTKRECSKYVKECLKNV